MARVSRDHGRVQQDTPTLTSAPPSAAATRRQQISAGVRDSFSAGLGIFPLGIALGLLVIQAHLPWWLAPALSLSAFAGSLELLLVGMMATVTPLAAFTSVLNSRITLPSATFTSDTQLSRP